MAEGVTILMACLDGAAHLPAQLQSIAAQTGVEWRLIVGDDGSTDGTWGMLEAFAAEWPGRVKLVRGPRAGVAAHFLGLFALAPPGPVAFADQDDVWKPGKLAEALAALGGLEGPAIFVARVALWDGAGGVRPLPVADGTGGFGQALVQNIGPGHAMVLNGEAAAMLAGLARAGARPMWHDWWAWQVVVGAGGRVVTGREVQVLYRQHGGNAVGRTTGISAALRQVRRVLDGRLRAEMDRQLGALDQSRGVLTAGASAQLDALRAARARRGWARARGVLKSGARRGGLLGQAKLAVAALVGGL